MQSNIIHHIWNMLPCSTQQVKSPKTSSGKGELLTGVENSKDKNQYAKNDNLESDGL